MKQFNMTETEKNVVIPFIEANRLRYPVFLNVHKLGIKIQSYKTVLSLNIQEGFFLRSYLMVKYPKNSRFKILDSNTFEIIE